jgi:hypothetical protein
MQLDTLLNYTVFFTYGAACMLSIIFTFSLESYRKISEKLNLDVFQGPTIVGILERDIDWLDNWLVRHNKIVGPLLILLSIVDLKLWLDIIHNSGIQ